jgi:hypothetical protein
MPNINRGRHIVDPAGPWRHVPDGLRCLGTVQRGHVIGALLVDRTGAFYCARGGTIEPLIWRKISAALAAGP